jgi:hypothetical protein
VRSAAPFPGEEGTPGRCVHARGCGGDCIRLASPRGIRKPGAAHTTVRGEGGGGLGRPEDKAQWGGRSAAGPGRKEAAQERERGEQAV